MHCLIFTDRVSGKDNAVKRVRPICLFSLLNQLIFDFLHLYGSRVKARAHQGSQVKVCNEVKGQCVEEEDRAMARP